MVLLQLHVVQCVFDKEGPLVTSVHFFVHRGEMKINARKVLLRRQTNGHALNGFSLRSPDKRRKEMQASVSSPLKPKGRQRRMRIQVAYSGDLSLFIALMNMNLLLGREVAVLLWTLHVEFFHQDLACPHLRGWAGWG